jgi:tetratricopeptide (TPR) repeat protein
MRPGLGWTITLLAALSATAVAQQYDPALEAMYNRGVSAWQRNELPSARAILDSVIARDARHGGAWATRATVRRFMGDVAGADADLSELIRLRPTAWTSYRMRGELRQALGDGRAKDDLARAEQLRLAADSQAQANPSPQRLDSMSGRIYATNMHRLRADSAVKRGDTATARVAYDAAVAADPRNFGVLFERGIFHYNQADTARARRDLTRAAELGDGRAQGLLNDKGMWDNPPLPPAQRAQAEREDSIQRTAPLVQSPVQAPTRPGLSLSEDIARYLPRPQVLALFAVLAGAAAALFALWYQLTPAPRNPGFPKLPDERHVWIGTPRQGLFFRSKYVGAFLFGLVWCAGVSQFALPMLEEAIQEGGMMWLFALFGMPFVLIGLYMLVGLPFVDARRRRITTYALTNQRVLISRGQTVNARSLDRLEEPVLEEHLDGTGTISLNAKVDDADFAKMMQAMQEGSLMKQALGMKRSSLSDFAAFSPRTNKSGRRIAPGAQFEHIADAPRVHKLMLDAMASVTAGELPSVSPPARTTSS